MNKPTSSYGCVRIKRLRQDSTNAVSFQYGLPFFRLRSRSKAVLLSVLSLFAVHAVVAQPMRLSPPVSISATNLSVSSTGINGHLNVFLWGTNVSNINTPLASARVGRSSIASIIFSTPSSSSSAFFIKASSTNVWTPAATLGGDFGLNILSLPEDQIALTNTEAVFIVQAVPLDTNNIVTYQWLKNETNIPGATNFFLHLLNVRTNLDVGFYACDVAAGTNSPYRARNKECDAPGARLYVYAGTNTPVTGPYQPAPEGAKVTSPCGTWSYVGWVVCKNPETVSRFYGTTYFDKPSWANNCVVTDLTVTLGLPSYTSRIYGVETSARPKFCGATNTPISVNPAYPPLNYLYQFTIYIISTGSLKLGDPINFEVKWGT